MGLRSSRRLRTQAGHPMVSRKPLHIGELPSQVISGGSGKRTFTGCQHCLRVLSAAEIVERWCVACRSETQPTDVSRGSRP